jgi:hypothetical protein
VHLLSLLRELVRRAAADTEEDDDQRERGPHSLRITCAAKPYAQREWLVPLASVFLLTNRVCPWEPCRSAVVVLTTSYPQEGEEER